MGKITSEMRPTASITTDEMQQEIRHTEAQITETLHSIEAKLSPQRLGREVKGRLISGIATAVVRVGYAIRRKPVPSAALGAGAIFLLARRRKEHAQAAKVQTEIGAALVEGAQRAAKRHPVQTVQTVRSAKRFFTVGKMVLAFASAAGAVLMRGQRAQEALKRRRNSGIGGHGARG